MSRRDAAPARYAIASAFTLPASQLLALRVFMLCLGPRLTGEFPMAKMSAETSVETAVYFSDAEPGHGVGSMPGMRATQVG